MERNGPHRSNLRPPSPSPRPRKHVKFDSRAKCYDGQAKKETQWSPSTFDQPTKTNPLSSKSRQAHKRYEDMDEALDFAEQELAEGLTVVQGLNPPSSQKHQKRSLLRNFREVQEYLKSSRDDLAELFDMLRVQGCNKRHITTEQAEEIGRLWESDYHARCELRRTRETLGYSRTNKKAAAERYAQQDKDSKATINNLSRRLNDAEEAIRKERWKSSGLENELLNIRRFQKTFPSSPSRPQNPQQVPAEAGSARSSGHQAFDGRLNDSTERQYSRDRSLNRDLRPFNEERRYSTGSRPPSMNMRNGFQRPRSYSEGGSHSRDSRRPTGAGFVPLADARASTPRSGDGDYDGRLPRLRSGQENLGDQYRDLLQECNAERLRLRSENTRLREDKIQLSSQVRQAQGRNIQLERSLLKMRNENGSGRGRSDSFRQMQQQCDNNTAQADFFAAETNRLATENNTLRNDNTSLKKRLADQAKMVAAQSASIAAATKDIVDARAERRRLKAILDQQARDMNRGSHRLGVRKVRKSSPVQARFRLRHDVGNGSYHRHDGIHPRDIGKKFAVKDGEEIVLIDLALDRIKHIFRPAY